MPYPTWLHPGWAAPWRLFCRLRDREDYDYSLEPESKEVHLLLQLAKDYQETALKNEREYVLETNAEALKRFPGLPRPSDSVRSVLPAGYLAPIQDIELTFDAKMDRLSIDISKAAKRSVEALMQMPPKDGNPPISYIKYDLADAYGDGNVVFWYEEGGSKYQTRYTLDAFRAHPAAIMKSAYDNICRAYENRDNAGRREQALNGRYPTQLVRTLHQDGTVEDHVHVRGRNNIIVEANTYVR